MMSGCGPESGQGLARSTMVRHSPGTTRAMGTGIWQGWAGPSACLGGPRARQIQTGIIIDCHCTWHFPFLIIPKKFVDFRIINTNRVRNNLSALGPFRFSPCLLYLIDSSSPELEASSRPATSHISQDAHNFFR